MCLPLLIPVMVAGLWPRPAVEAPPVARVVSVNCRGLRPGMKAPAAPELSVQDGVISQVRGVRPGDVLLDQNGRFLLAPQGEPVLYARLDQWFGRAEYSGGSGGHFQARYVPLGLTLDLSTIVNSWTWAFPPRPGGGDWAGFLQERKVTPVSFVIRAAE